MTRDSSPFITMRHHPSQEHTQPFITAELHSPTVTTTTANACCNCLPPQRRTRQLQRRVAPTATGAEHLALEKKRNVKRLISLLLLVSIPGILLCSGLQLSNHKRIKLNLTSIKQGKKFSRAPLSPGWSITLIASPPPLPKVHTAMLIIQLATAVAVGIKHAITGLQQSSAATKQGPVAAQTARGASRVYTLGPAHTHTFQLVYTILVRTLLMADTELVCTRLWVYEHALRGREMGL